jgi:hypothetical protein
VVGVGLIAAIAIPNIASNDAKQRADPVSERGSLREPDASEGRAVSAQSSANESAAAKRSAQSIASIYAAGQAAGVEWQASNVDEAVNCVLQGKAPTQGPFKGRVFKNATVSAAMIPAVKRYLKWDENSEGIMYVSVL